MKRIMFMGGRGFLALMDFLWALSAIVICTAWWLGWIYKDSTPLMMWLFFIPPILVILFGFIWLFLTLHNRFRLIQLFVFVTIFTCFFKVLVIDHHWNRKPAKLPDDNIRILHWNTAWGVLGVESIVRTMSYDYPDIVLISEPPRLDMISDIAYHALGMENIFTDSGMTIASRFPITYMGNIPIESGVAWRVRIDTSEGPLEFVAADLVSHPKLNRKRPLKSLAAWIDTRTNDIPLVMVGDFNTAHDSVAFEPLRQRMKHAYQVNGRGWPYTWPVPFPVFAIDHTWVSPNIIVNDYFLKVARYSDHKRQIADISFGRKKFIEKVEGVGP